MNNSPKLCSVQIELTNRCNERCVHCYIPHEWKNRDMDFSLLKHILEQCKDMGVEHITFSGGEPMLHGNFLEALGEADRRGFDISIFSNLTLLSGKILTELKTKRVKNVQASLYSTEPGIHDSITGLTGSCEKTKHGIESLVKNGIPAFISCPLMKQNKDSYPGILDYAKRLNIGCAPNSTIGAQSGGGTENLAHRLSPDEALSLIQDILEHDTAYNAERFLPGYDNTADALPCVQAIGKDALCVNAKGEVLASPAWNRVLGDLNTQPLRDIWENSGELQKIRAISLDDFPQCRSCPDIQFCGMSLEDNANENQAGNPFIIPGHVCVLARRKRELIHGWHRKNNTNKETL
jgi:radical SAM protein with 4Fe4S-binding SPASM domain